MVKRKTTRRPTATIVDPIAEKFSRSITPDHAGAVFHETAEELAQLATTHLSRQHREGQVELAGQEAAEFLDELISAWALVINRDSTWSSGKAIYMQRRFPLELCWSFLEESGFAASEFVEVATHGTMRLLTVLGGALPGRDQAPQRNIGLAPAADYEVSAADAIAFLQRVCRTQHLWLLQNTARIVGKGGVLSFKVGELPGADESDEVRRAMELFDARQLQTGEVGIVGTTAWIPRTDLSPTTVGWWLYTPDAPMARASETLKNHLNIDASQSRSLRHDVRFSMELRDLSPFIKLISSAKSAAWSDAESSAILTLLYALARTDDVSLGWGLDRVGYVRIARDLLFSQIAASLGWEIPAR